MKDKARSDIVELQDNNTTKGVHLILCREPVSAMPCFTAKQHSEVQIQRTLKNPKSHLTLPLLGVTL